MLAFFLDFEIDSLIIFDKRKRFANYLYPENKYLFRKTPPCRIKQHKYRVTQKRGPIVLDAYPCNMPLYCGKFDSGKVGNREGML